MYAARAADQILNTDREMFYTAGKYNMNNHQIEKRPRITIMGENGMEEVPFEELPAAEAIDLSDHFKRVKLSPAAINEASKIVPIDVWKRIGLYTWLFKAANHVFSKISVGQTEARFGVLKYVFEYDADGPVLKTVSL